MRNSINALASLSICTGLFLTAPAAAQDLVEPAQSAQPLNADAWQRAVSRELPAIQRFRGLPELRFGFLVDTAGNVRTCLALPTEVDTRARGQALCGALIEHARFQPALDDEGNAVESVFVANFAATAPVTATSADLAGVPIL
ncbi:hypothetical protein D6201_07870 [Aurantiacibacter aquimixticola]|uniref:TonB C-terminal domain-containing protein n=1 Tax=Aurantiacibacter aquimixticola TaxID=1958945 RepID=A0A419RU12_9SPHN|nr:hypothetical protein D6201_07870 [Aurantiacibacter aquimixticola]